MEDHMNTQMENEIEAAGSLGMFMVELAGG